MFREYEAVYTPPAPKVTGKENLNITVLNGDSTQIPYYSFMPMSEVQMHINSKLDIPPNKQKILFEDREVKVFIFIFMCLFILSCLIFFECAPPPTDSTKWALFVSNLFFKMCPHFAYTALRMCQVYSWKGGRKLKFLWKWFPCSRVSVYIS